MGIASEKDRVGEFVWEGDVRTEINNQYVTAYRCDCGNEECRTIGLTCVSVHVNGNEAIVDNLCMSPAAWRETIRKIEGIMVKEFPYDI